MNQSLYPIVGRFENLAFMRHLFTLSFLMVCLVSSFSQGFKINSFDAQIQISKEGKIQVTETLDVFFTEQKRGIFRDIPYRFSNNGMKYETEISDISVDNHPYKVSKKSGMKSIRIGDPDVYLTGPQKYVIRYTVEGPFISTPEYSEFYWNITGNDWQAVIEKASFSVLLPDSISIRYNNLRVFTGMEGENGKEATIRQEGRTIKGETTAAINPGQGLTIAIKLPKDYVPANATLEVDTPPPPPKGLADQWPMSLLPIGLILGLFGFWKKMRGSDELDDIEPKPYPPLDLTPAETGAFYDHIVHDRDVISLLPYWAHQGFIKMEKDKANDEMYITKIKQLDGERPDYEYTLFNDLFTGRNYVTLTDLKYNFYDTHQKVKSQIKKEIIDLQLYDDQYRYWFKSWRLWILFVAILPLIMVFFYFQYWLSAIILMLMLVLIIVLASLGSRTSEKGLRVKKDLRAFYNFLRNDDTSSYPELIKNDPQYFEKVYPYAVAFNLDKTFTSRIKPYQTMAPMWYGYYGGYYPHGHNNTMEDFSSDFSPKEISSAFSTVASSSGSSGGGFSGGSSGGGFGGGGGGSW